MESWECVWRMPTRLEVSVRNLEMLQTFAGRTRWSTSPPPKDVPGALAPICLPSSHSIRPGFARGLGHDLLSEDQFLPRALFPRQPLRAQRQCSSRPESSRLPLKLSE